jgi:hypothetical protein
VRIEIQELLTFADVSRITKIKINTLRKWVLVNKIPYTKINGAIRFFPVDIQNWMALNAHGELLNGKNGGALVPVIKDGELFPAVSHPVGGVDDGF